MYTRFFPKYLSTPCIHTHEAFTIIIHSWYQVLKWCSCTKEWGMIVFFLLYTYMSCSLLLQGPCWKWRYCFRTSGCWFMGFSPAEAHPKVVYIYLLLWNGFDSVWEYGVHFFVHWAWCAHDELSRTCLTSCSYKIRGKKAALLCWGSKICSCLCGVGLTLWHHHECAVKNKFDLMVLQNMVGGKGNRWWDIVPIRASQP